MADTNNTGGVCCHDADACCAGQLPCPTPGACQISEPMNMAEMPENLAAIVACLGDDAAALREENPEDERADNMDAAAAELRRLHALSAAAPAAPAEREPSPTAGMSLAQRILHVGGRNNAAGYVEFGSIQAVKALVSQVLRDLPSAAPPQAQQPSAAEVAPTLTQAAHDVLAERQRQISVEGWTPEHDDEHDFGQLARAGAAYAAQSLCAEDAELECGPPGWWPWERTWWKPNSRRGMLVKAGALILAEMERLDRAAGKGAAAAAPAAQVEAPPAAVSAPSVPEGWKMVPVEPTSEMLAAVKPFPESLVAEREAEGHSDYRHKMKAATLADQMALAQDYRDMLAAAPQAPAQEGGAS